MTLIYHVGSSVFVHTFIIYNIIYKAASVLSVIAQHITVKDIAHSFIIYHCVGAIGLQSCKSASIIHPR